MEEEKGWLQRVASHLADRLNPKTIAKEGFDALTDKVIPHGATELAQGLYGGQSNAFTPYGHAQSPLEVEGPQQSYTDALRQAAKHEPPDQDLKMGM